MSYDIQEQDHAGWIAPGQIEPTEDFDFDEVDRHLAGIEEEPEDVQARAAVVMSRIFAEVWAGNSLHAALVKFCAIRSRDAAMLASWRFRTIYGIKTLPGGVYPLAAIQRAVNADARKTKTRQR